MNNSKNITEFLGTFFLVSVVAFTGDPLAIGVALMVLVYMGAHISGAHYNPAVTFALFIRKQITQIEARAYMLSQFAGGAAAAIFYSIVEDKMFVPHMGRGTTWLTAFSVEAIFTFLLVYTIFSVAVDARVKGNQYFGAAIGGALMLGAFVGGSISGGAFNPAVGVAPLLVDFKNISDNLPEIALYLSGPLFGAAVAAKMHQKK